MCALLKIKLCLLLLLDPAALTAATCCPCSDVRSCIAFPAWTHNLLAALSPRLDELSVFDSVKLVMTINDLGYKPARHFLNQLATAMEVSEGGRKRVKGVGGARSICPNAHQATSYDEQALTQAAVVAAADLAPLWLLRLPPRGTG